MAYWYENTMRMHKSKLTEIVNSRKSTIKTFFYSSIKNGNTESEEAYQATIDLIKYNFNDIQSFGDEVDITLLSKIGDNYDILYANKGVNHTKGYSPEDDEAVKIAGNKESGVIISEYHGTKHLVAYDFLDIYNARIIITAKTGYMEIIKPELFSAIVTGLISLSLILVGGYAFDQYSKMNLMMLQKANKELEIFGKIMSSAREFMSYVDKDHRYVAINQTYLDNFKVTKEEIIGKTMREFHEEEIYSTFLRDSLEKAFNGEIVKYYGWFDFDNNEKFLEINFVPHIVDGDIEGLVITASDITKQEISRQALVKKTLELEELTVKLEEKVKVETEKRLQNEQLFFEQKKFADMGQMINAIAHQWRQPINSLGLYTQYIYDSVKDGTIDDDMLEDFKKDTITMVQHMSKTIDDFRNFFDPRTEETQFEVIKAALETISLVEAQLKNNFINFSVSCECSENKFNACNNLEHPPCKHPETLVTGYPSEFKQVLMNLIQNAKDAVEGKSSNKIINLKVISKEKEIIVKIEDNGTGINPEILGRIFNPYFTTKDEGKGTGIGLYMSKLIIEEHMKGTLSAYNNESGATFEIRVKKA
jgi:PAS domain S-box-containing protein